MEDGHVRTDSGENGLLLALHLVGIAGGGGPDPSTGSRPCNSYQREHSGMSLHSANCDPWYVDFSSCSWSGDHL
jgi:hypothetical protein